LTGLKFLKYPSISSTIAVFFSVERYSSKLMLVGCAERRLSLRLASSLRFLKARSAAAVWPLRPSEDVILAQSSLEAAERCLQGKKSVSSE
jgi:hypothetical protein